jgi:streptogramin lyase
VKRIHLLALVALLLLPAAAQAFEFQIGDVLAGLQGQVQVWRGSAIVNTLTVPPTYTTGMATDKAGNVYVTNLVTVTKYDKTGAVLANPFVTPGGTPESIVFDKAQNFYLSDVGGGIGVTKYDLSGNKLATYSNIGRTDWIDLAQDQTTLYYTTEGNFVGRYDTVTGTVLSNFATGLTGGSAFALRILSDGGVLVADGAFVQRLDSAGNKIQTYDVTGEDTWFALNLDPDGKTFWSGNYGTGKFYHFDIASGSQIGSAYDTGTGYYSLFGLAVYGEITQGGGGVTTPVPPALLLFGSALLGLIGFRRFQK